MRTFCLRRCAAALAAALVLLPPPSFGASWEQEMKDRDTMSACMAPPPDPSQPYAGISLPGGTPADAATLCKQHIAYTYDTSRHPVRYQSFLKLPHIMNGTNALPGGLAGIWFGQVRLDEKDWQHRVLYIYDNKVYLFRPDGQREKILWKVHGDKLYFSTNFKYQHQVQLAGAERGKPLTCTLDEIATPTELEIDPQEKNVWQPVKITAKKGFLAIASVSGKQKAHKDDSDVPLTPVKIDATAAAKAKKDSLSLAYTFAINPTTDPFFLPMHHTVRYPARRVSQEFSIIHPKLGSEGTAFFSQALIGRTEAELFLAVDRLPVTRLEQPAAPACASKDFGTFFPAYSILPLAEQALCLKMPLTLTNGEASQQPERIQDFYTLLHDKSVAAGVILDGTQLAKKQRSYRVVKQEQEAVTVLLEEKNKKIAAYSFYWDSKNWRLRAIARYSE